MTAAPDTHDAHGSPAQLIHGFRETRVVQPKIRGGRLVFWRLWADSKEREDWRAIHDPAEHLECLNGYLRAGVERYISREFSGSLFSRRNRPVTLSGTFGTVKFFFKTGFCQCSDVFWIKPDGDELELDPATGPKEADLTAAINEVGRRLREEKENEGSGVLPVTLEDFRAQGMKIPMRR